MLQRQGKIERIILEMIENRRNRSPDDRTARVIEVREFDLEAKLHGFSEPTRSAKVAIRAAMRRFADKHPSFALERRERSWGEPS